MEYMPMSAPEKVDFQEAIAVRDVGLSQWSILCDTVA
ncbi:hypothetical protein P3T31_001297 [Rhizobium sp. AN70]|nr:hypothetical protein [Rhizobium sp. AN70]